VKPADDSSSTSVDGKQLQYYYLEAPIEGVPDIGENPHPSFYLSFINNEAKITENKLHANKFLIQKV